MIGELSPYYKIKTGSILENKKKGAYCDLFSKKSFCIQIKDYSAFHCFGKGHIFILVGSSSAGKSTFIQKFIEKHRDTQVQGIDQQSFKMAIEFIKTHYPDEVSFLNEVLEIREDDLHLLHAALWESYFFKNEVLEDEKIRTRQILKKIADHLRKNLWGIPLKRECLLLEKVFLDSQKGKNTILDLLSVETIFHALIKNRFIAPITLTLVYCPFDRLIHRIKERNRKAIESGEYHEIRKGLFPLFQFAHHFEARKRKEDPVFDILSRKQVEKSFEELFDYIFQENLHKQEVQKEKENGRLALLKAFGFHDSSIENIELTPRYKRYDFIIDTSKTYPEF
ncbi:hypothetical protein [Criblamydia sequanensis]|uniref:Uncharacterized protein n=1 Tax=Candidatus Criblamydia sequanensis CRIB-18 TaxID=1437425 RepID=A0A090CZL2_9BACT|nr:hypothetical protein [Criblamydia sequanensis]CDR34572.1 hypothetical protein CSEC_1761 [Criblamydia sequanensis CRIB-18]